MSADHFDWQHPSSEPREFTTVEIRSPDSTVTISVCSCEVAANTFCPVHGYHGKPAR